MKCQYYNASIYFITHLEVFCQSGGFELLKLILQGHARKGVKPTPGGYNPAFRLFTRVMGIVYNLKEYFELPFYQSLVFDLKDLCLDYAQNRFDEDALRRVDKRDLGLFIHQIESLLNSVVFERNKNGESMSFEADVYQYTE
jgi:hypothetical protein